MKIALFSLGSMSLKLGATKNRIELADALRKQGWDTSLISSIDMGINSKDLFNMELYNNTLKQYLIDNAHNYDVVLYEYNSLPFDRKLFSPDTLFVARPALLHYNYETIKIPKLFFNKLKYFIKQLLTLDFHSFSKAEREKFKWGEITLLNCDLIQVQSNRDKNILISKGFEADKINIVPNGISKERFALFNTQDTTKKAKDLCIAFVGTFDSRKGAIDFPYIVKQVKSKFPNAVFKLLGTKGFNATIEDVLKFFPSRYHKDIVVMPEFEPTDLPKYLSDCHLGIFPSYFESFGFGALEMMAAGLPVVSYNVSGPSDFAIYDLVVPIGDKKKMVQKIIELANDDNKLILYSNQAKAQSKLYDWEIIGKHASDTYRQRINDLKARRLT
jgi:glycosyltransferase involved in cell wall biosynthesis